MNNPTCAICSQEIEGTPVYMTGTEPVCPPPYDDDEERCVTRYRESVAWRKDHEIEDDEPASIDLPGWLKSCRIDQDESGNWHVEVCGDAYGIGRESCTREVGRNPMEAFNGAVDRAEGWTSYTLERTSDAATLPQEGADAG